MPDTYALACLAKIPGRQGSSSGSSSSTDAKLCWCVGADPLVKIVSAGKGEDSQVAGIDKSNVCIVVFNASHGKSLPVWREC